MSRHSSVCHDRISRKIVEAMLQQETFYHNKDQAELNEEKKLSRNKEFLCRDTTEEDCRDILYYVATLIKVIGSGTLLRHSLICCNIEE